ncbi:MAG: alpha/beta hydrolase [Symploca sp. SIO2B6]|nr:alpha/beta hydrolase [Symploca sp. SIO2B6]
MESKTFGKELKNLIRPNQLVFRRWFRSLGLGVICTILSAIPVNAAERIYFDYGPLALSISVDSLETFAKEGKINKELEFYLKRVSEENQATFREVLQTKQEVDPVQLYRFFRTPIGEQLLTGFGKIIQVQGGRNGKYSIRGALVQAAADPEGLTVLNFMRKFSTNIELNTDQILEVSGLLEKIVKATDEMVSQISRLAAAEAATENSVNFSILPDIRKTGEFGFRKQIITLKDNSRQREFRVELYQPQRWRAGQTPVVIASHGLASTPEHFQQPAQHLASYGYVVALLQHPGSDLTYLQNTLAGYSRDIFRIEEFIDRPLDVSYVLDELARRNQAEFAGKLNLQEVGVIGHSFGGYTALALAGAEIDFERLETDCNRVVWDPNLSLLVQCRALELPRKAYNFRDPRVKAAIAINPVNSSVFGPKGLSKIQIPVFLGAGTLDPATPAVLEQMRSFTWLNTPNKHLGLLEGQAHLNFSQLDAGTKAMIDSLPNLKLPPQSLIDDYGNAMMLSFLEVHVVTNSEYRPYLQSSYAEYISQEPFKFYLISSSSVNELNRVIQEFKAREGISDR